MNRPQSLGLRACGALLTICLIQPLQLLAADSCRCEACAAAADRACQPAPPPAPPIDYGGCCCCRSKLTGNWCENCLCRPCLAESGFTLDADHTYFYQGVASGGVEQDFELGGHGDYVLNFDMGKMGVQEGLFVKLRAEHRFGDSIAQDTGALLPPAIPVELPVNDSDDVYLTNVLFTQALSESFAVFAGKLDTLDGDANAFAHGRGKTQFSNMAFVGNPIALRTVPYSTLGAGFVVLQEMQPIFTFTALNATDTTKTTGFDELFEEGVALTAELRLPTTFGELPGHQLFGGTWNSRDFVSLGQDPRIILPDVPIARQSDSWSAYWNMDQYVCVDPCQPARGWGYFARAGIADDQTNPLAYFLSAGLGGNSGIRGRETDTFGIGYYYTGSSDEIGPLLTALVGPVGDGQGVELFYNIEITPWFHLTPDLQIVDPAREAVDTALVAGLRAKIDF